MRVEDMGEPERREVPIGVGDSRRGERREMGYERKGTEAERDQEEDE